MPTRSAVVEKPHVTRAQCPIGVGKTSGLIAVRWEPRVRRAERERTRMGHEATNSSETIMCSYADRLGRGEVFTGHDARLARLARHICVVGIRIPMPRAAIEIQGCAG